MRFRLLKLRFKKRLTQGELKAEVLGQQAELGIERYFFRRIGRLYKVRRFTISWLALMLLISVATIGQAYLLSADYQTLRPVPGGIYNEGVIGTFTTANPIYAESDIDTTMSHLLFASLLTYNSANQLTGELASSYSSNSQGTIYTVHLRPGLTWQDGQPLTAKDVLFTFNLIENPDAQSPLFNSWQNVKVTAEGPLTITFKLPDPLVSFPEDLTTGILPEHLLAKIPAGSMRSATFNTSDPVGSGPFIWQAVSVSGNDPTNAIEQIVLSPFDHYVLGKPKLNQFVVHAYASQDQLISAFESGQLSGAEGLSLLPAAIAKKRNVEVHNLILTAGVYAFFKTSSGVLANATVRSALIQAVNIPAIISSLGYPTHAVNEPFLEGQLGYNPSDGEPGYNQGTAVSALQQAGWQTQSNGIRTNNGQTLQFNLTVSDSSEYLTVAKELQHYWLQVGARVNLVIEDPSDFNTVLENHDYQAILYGIAIGVDPDVFVYWDSSQAAANSPSRLNLSEWSNTTADESLEEGRTRLDPALRVIKYQGFLQAWQHDLPALGLYQPRLLYLTNGPVFGLNANSINSNTDRFNDIQNWEIDEARVTN